MRPYRGRRLLDLSRCLLQLFIRPRNSQSRVAIMDRSDGTEVEFVVAVDRLFLRQRGFRRFRPLFRGLCQELGALVLLLLLELLFTFLFSDDILEVLPERLGDTDIREALLLRRKGFRESLECLRRGK